jgi:hypothetical protein
MSPIDALEVQQKLPHMKMALWDRANSQSEKQQTLST